MCKHNIIPLYLSNFNQGYCDLLFKINNFLSFCFPPKGLHNLSWYAPLETSSLVKEFSLIDSSPLAKDLISLAGWHRAHWTSVGLQGSKNDEDVVVQEGGETCVLCISAQPHTQTHSDYFKRVFPSQALISGIHIDKHTALLTLLSLFPFFIHTQEGMEDPQWPLTFTPTIFQDCAATLLSSKLPTRRELLHRKEGLKLRQGATEENEDFPGQTDPYPLTYFQMLLISVETQAKVMHKKIK